MATRDTPGSHLKGNVSATVFDLIGNKDCSALELMECLTEWKKANPHKKYNHLKSSERHNLLHEMVNKGRLSLFIVILHLGLWKDMSREKVPRDGFSDHTGCTPLEIAKKKKTKKPIEELGIYDRWEDSLSQLMRCCRSGDVSEVKKIVTRRNLRELNVKDTNEMNALYWAVVGGKQEIVTLLLNSGVDPSVKSARQETLLHVATMHGKSHLLETLINEKRCQLDPYEEDLNSKSPYDRCAENGDIKTLKQLIKVGKAPKESFVVLAAFNGRQTCVEYCISTLKMSVNCKDAYDRTVVLRACEGSRTDVVKFLIHRGADLKVCSSSNRNVFHMVAETGNLEVLRLLFEQLTSAEITPMLNQRDRYTGTDLCFLIRGTDKNRDAWHYCEVTRWKCPVFLRKTRVGNVDVAQFGDIIKSGWGVNPSHQEVADIEGMFKKRRLDKDAREDMTPLHIACFKGHVKVVEQFVAQHAEPGVVDMFTLTPIMLAAAKGEQDIVEMLQKAGASLKEMTRDNQNIETIALYNDQNHITKYLNSLDVFQLSENFTRANIRKVRELLDPQKLQEVRRSGIDVKKHIIDTLREFKIDINQHLVSIGSGPVLEVSEE